MFKKRLVYIMASMAVIPALWIIGRAVVIRSRPATPEYKLQIIAKTQVWQLADVQARDRAWNQLDAHKEIAAEDWQTLVKAGNEEKNAFDVSLILMFTHHQIEDKYKDTLLKWCERNMAQTNDASAAVLGYFGYVRAGGPDKDAWGSRLKARGSTYPGDIIKQDELAEKIGKRLEAEKEAGH